MCHKIMKEQIALLIAQQDINIYNVYFFKEETIYIVVVVLLLKIGTINLFLPSKKSL